MGARILVVDDEEIVIKSCLRILGGGDYHVEAAYDSWEALRKVEENPYDVIILDVMMPNIGGLEVLRRVKETHPDVDVIMITGLSQVETVAQASLLSSGLFFRAQLQPSPNQEGAREPSHSGG
jgi:CheY-like chemotaxis protein